MEVIKQFDSINLLYHGKRMLKNIHFHLHVDQNLPNLYPVLYI